MHLCFHFAEGNEIVICQNALMDNPNHRNAFAPSPTAIATLNPNYQGNREPMAFCAQVNKLGVRRNDIQRIPFFYM